MVFEEKPLKFNSRFDIVSCFLESEGRILLLHRQDHKPQGDTWGVPAGKVDGSETPEEAIMREISEEIGHKLPWEKLAAFRKVYVRYPDYDFVYHIFHLSLTSVPAITINHKEHKAYSWVTPREALLMDLIPDEDACIKLYYGID